jgi:hypothetical protein
MHHTKVGPWGWRMLKWFLGSFFNNLPKGYLTFFILPLIPKLPTLYNLLWLELHPSFCGGFWFHVF